eukprot:CAMPEP_0198138070 /NCGR_PEP_ID=MMETSP1443-20131203/1506_1 /TAXON_ID=186043 /ORGANISM="Entomoneis sp., Strain CCMP2396" /LENGTH=197 /DNA_ID=CAMNT_0043799705 /DNA_START=25 /DNA_END=618 /DNA_ORIENTATION=+
MTMAITDEQPIGEERIADKDCSPMKNNQTSSRSIMFPGDHHQHHHAADKEKGRRCSASTMDTVASSFGSFNLKDDEEDFLDHDNSCPLREEQPSLLSRNENDFSNDQSGIISHEDDQALPSNSFDRLGGDDFEGGNDPRAMWSLQAQRHLTLNFDDDQINNDSSEASSADDLCPTSARSMMCRGDSLHQTQLIEDPL